MLRKLKNGHRIILLRKKTVTVIAGILLASLILYTVGGSPIVGASATVRQLPIYCVQRDTKMVALSFDAAWGNEDTSLLIEILARYNVKTTFFVVGGWVDKYPQSVKELADAGHEVMNHSSTHAHFSKLSQEQIISEVSTCNDKIEAITGARPILFRAPYGEYDDHVINTLNGMGMYTIQWDVDSLDWKGISASEITQRVTSKVTPGSIVLFHNAAIHTPEALPAILDYLTKNGYSVVRISDIILRDNYTIDHTGRQIPKS